jgi:hypothetical protein
MDRDLRLNSIDRYVKSSPRFVLEEHSGCEVPAGCGGVVLRWRDAKTEVPVRMHVATMNVTEIDVRVDGGRLPSSRPLLAPGPHELTIDLVAATSATAQFLFYARLAPDTSPVTPQDAVPLLTTAVAQPWEWTELLDPAPGALVPADADWRPMVPGELPADEKERGYQVSRLARDGAAPLTTPDWVPHLRVRTRFEIEPKR